MIVLICALVVVFIIMCIKTALVATNAKIAELQAEEANIQMLIYGVEKESEKESC